MNPSEIEKLQNIKTLPSLIKYLRDDLDWPIGPDTVEDDITFTYSVEELGLEKEYENIVKDIKQIRPLDSKQPWGIFWINFDKKKLPVVILRRILGHLVIKRRANAKKAKQASWQQNDLMFISSYGEEHDRAVTFAHFSQDPINPDDLPALKVLGWDGSDTVLHLADADQTLKEKLRWPADPGDQETWRKTWSSAFSMRHREVITTTEEMVEELARLATAIYKKTKTAIHKESAKGPLRRLHASFKACLIHDLDEDGFADVIAQTISYGLLTARFSRPAGITVQNLVDMVPSTNPFLRELLGMFLHLAGRQPLFDFDELGIQDVVDLLNRANAEAVKNDFGNKTRGEDPVIHFYEHFLSAYNKKQKIQRGVFYTPQPVVSYIVRSVHELLQTEFGLEDGLASTVTWREMAKRNKNLKIPEGVKPDSAFVQILDPATGTATFLVEVIDVIHKTMLAKWQKQGMSEKLKSTAWNQYVPEHLLTRLHGYELMMAPYAIAHMKIGLKLFETGYQFMSDERARIYLTNALEPPQDFSDRLGFDVPALAHEAQAVNAIKRHQRFTVIIGNPPYSYESTNNGPWIASLMSDYMLVDGAVLGERNPRGLQDDYVKFVRLAQFSLDQSGAGVLGLITNHGFLSNPTFRGMRQCILSALGSVFALDLHGNANRGERAPDGGVDENVFDILQGVSIFCGSKGAAIGRNRGAHFDLFGDRDSKYKFLREHAVGSTTWNQFVSESPFYLLVFRKLDLQSEYSASISISEIFPINSVGISTSRDSLCVRFSSKEMFQTVDRFSSLPTEKARVEFDLGPDVAEWSVALAKRDLKESGVSKDAIVPIFYRPFDVRFTYFTGQSRGFHSCPRPEVMRHMLGGKNLALCSNRQVNNQFRHVFVTRHISDGNAVSLASRERTYLFPLFLHIEDRESELCLLLEKQPNLKSMFLEQVAQTLGLSRNPNGIPRGLTPEEIFHYSYAVFHSPGYRSRYAEFLKIDFPRLPLTSDLELFHALAKLGGELVALHLMESTKLNKPITEFVGDAKTVIEKVIYSNQTVWIDKANTTGFKGVPENVWSFHIGGYQVCEKWLKDRKGRKLSNDDIEYYHKIIIALSETIRLMSEIDKVIDAHGGWPKAFAPKTLKEQKNVAKTV